VTLTPSGALDAKVYSNGTAPPNGSFNIDYLVTNKFGLSSPGRAYLSIGPGGTPYLSFAPVARNYYYNGGMGQKQYVSLNDARNFDSNITSLARFVIDAPGAVDVQVIDNGATILWKPDLKFEGKDTFLYHIDNFALVDGVLVPAGSSNIAFVNITEKGYLTRSQGGAWNNTLPGWQIGFQKPWSLYAAGLTDKPVVVIQKITATITITLKGAASHSYTASYYEIIGITGHGESLTKLDPWKYGLNPRTDKLGKSLYYSVKIEVVGKLRAYEYTSALKTILDDWNTDAFPFRNSSGLINGDLGFLSTGEFSGSAIPSDPKQDPLMGFERIKEENGQGRFSGTWNPRTNVLQESTSK
jgi:hypothetical protein